MPEGAYDLVVLGTGVAECVLAGLLSRKGLRVVQIDESATYGSGTKTLSYTDFVRHVAECGGASFVLGGGGKDARERLQIDLVPKLFVASERIVQMAGRAQISHCLEFNVVEKNYVARGGKLIPIPSGKAAAMTSNLCNPLQMVKVARFFETVQKYHGRCKKRRKAAQRAQGAEKEDVPCGGGL